MITPFLTLLVLSADVGIIAVIPRGVLMAALTRAGWEHREHTLTLRPKLGRAVTDTAL